MYEIEKITRPVLTAHYLIHFKGDVIALTYTQADAIAVQKALNDELTKLESFTQDLSKMLMGTIQ